MIRLYIINLLLVYIAISLACSANASDVTIDNSITEGFTFHVVSGRAADSERLTFTSEIHSVHSDLAFIRAVRYFSDDCNTLIHMPFDEYVVISRQGRQSVSKSWTLRGGAPGMHMIGGFHSRHPTVIQTTILRKEIVQRVMQDDDLPADHPPFDLDVKLGVRVLRFDTDSSQFVEDGIAVSESIRLRIYDDSIRVVSYTVDGSIIEVTERDGDVFRWRILPPLND